MGLRGWGQGDFLASEFQNQGKTLGALYFWTRSDYIKLLTDGCKWGQLLVAPLVGRGLIPPRFLNPALLLRSLPAWILLGVCKRRAQPWSCAIGRTFLATLVAPGREATGFSFLALR